MSSNSNEAVTTPTELPATTTTTTISPAETTSASTSAEDPPAPAPPTAEPTTPPDTTNTIAVPHPPVHPLPPAPGQQDSSTRPLRAANLRGLPAVVLGGAYWAALYHRDGHVQAANDVEDMGRQAFGDVALRRAMRNAVVGMVVGIMRQHG